MRAIGIESGTSQGHALPCSYSTGLSHRTAHLFAQKDFTQPLPSRAGESLLGTQPGAPPFLIPTPVVGCPRRLEDIVGVEPARRASSPRQLADACPGTRCTSDALPVSAQVDVVILYRANISCSRGGLSHDQWRVTPAIL